MSILSITKFFILKYGVISVFFASMLEYLCIPVPIEIVLPFVGALAKSNNQNIFLLTLVAVLGGTTGSLIMFLVSKYILKNFVEDLEKKFPKFETSAKKSEKFLYKYRYIGVFLSRTAPAARTVTSIIAPLINMKLSKFLLFSALGMTIWDFMLIKLGTMVTVNHSLISELVKKYILLIVPLIILIIGLYSFIKSKRSKKNSL